MHSPAGRKAVRTELNLTILPRNQIYLTFTDEFIQWHQNTNFSYTHMGTFTKIDDILSHEEHLNGVKIIEMICYSPVDHNMKSLSIKEIESIINNLSNGKHQVLVGSCEFYPTLMEKLCQFSTLFQKIKTKGILANSFWGQPYPNIKSRQIHYKKEKLQTSSSHKQRCKKPSKLTNWTKCTKSITHHDQKELSQVFKAGQHIGVNAGSLPH